MRRRTSSLKPDARRGVLVTRPVAEAHETAERLTALGWRPVLAPCIRIVPRPLALAPGWRPQAVLVTSGNALAALSESLHRVPLLAVGDATAARARALGFSRVCSAGRDAAALLHLTGLCCRPDGGRLLLASGEGQGIDLAAGLRGRGFQVTRRVAYAARPVPWLPPQARASLRGGTAGAALFFSPVTAVAFGRAARRSDLIACLAPVVAVAISPATAAALAPLAWRDVRVAERPNQDELLACLR